MFDKIYSDSLAYDMGVHIANTGCTVRQCAAVFNVSKSTVFQYVKEKLPEIDAEVSEAVEIVLQMNKEVSAIRGGLATKAKWRSICKQKSQN